MSILYNNIYTIKSEHYTVINQSGSADCGLYAIAIATALAHEIDPALVAFQQDELRLHLIDSFQKNLITPFSY
jgi:hypothetical protein